MSTIPTIDMSAFETEVVVEAETPAPATPDDSIVLEGAAPIQKDEAPETIASLRDDLPYSIKRWLPEDATPEEILMADQPVMEPEEMSFRIRRLERIVKNVVTRIEGQADQISHQIEHLVEGTISRFQELEEKVPALSLIAIGEALAPLAHATRHAVTQRDRAKRTRIFWLEEPSADVHAHNLMVAVKPREEGSTTPEQVIIRVRAEGQALKDVTDQFDDMVKGVVRTSALNEGYVDGQFRWAIINDGAVIPN